MSLTTLAHAVDVFVQQKLSLDDSEVEPASAAILALADSTYESGLWADKPDQQGNLANTGMSILKLIINFLILFRIGVVRSFQTKT